MENCTDIINPFTKEVISEKIPFQLLGGLGSAAILESTTSYDIENRQIITNDPLYIASKRPNGSLRDVDVLVLSSKGEDIKKVETIAQETIQNLEVNVFGLHQETEINLMQRNLLSKVAILGAVSDRYLIGDDNQLTDKGFYKAIFPFGVRAPKEALETWHLINNNHEPVPVPNPAMMILNNTTRSIAGLRHKYDQKITVMTDNLLRNDPKLIDWMIDGPGSSHLSLAASLRTLGWKKVFRDVPSLKLSELKNITINPPKMETLINDSTFLMSDSPLIVKKFLINLARFKSAYFVGPMERHFMDLWEKHDLEHYCKNIVRNRH